MIGFPLGLLVANATEWVVHRYVLHGLGKKKGSFWSFHWHEHHRQTRRSDFVDPDYHRSAFGWNAQGKEVYGLLGLCLGVLPIAPASPWFCAGVWSACYGYYRVHKKSHLDAAWARKYLPWHYDHHMAPNQEANWCVTYPLIDHLMGTREVYLGTEREVRDRARANGRKRAGSPVAAAASN